MEHSSGIYALGEAGLGMPAGFAGVGVGVMPVRWATWDVTVGLTDSGVAVATMLGVSLPVSDRASLGLGSGVSVGPYSDGPDFLQFSVDYGDYLMVWNWVLWSNTRFQVRHAINDSFMLRLDAGVTVPVARATGHCVTEDECLEASFPDLLPYVGAGLEYHY